MPQPDTHTRKFPHPMSLPKRSSPSPQQPLDSARDLKKRVITCFNKLSDRDTLAIATTELESIARNLTHDSFSPFLNCIHSTDSSDKSPVRKQCVRLLGLLSETHGDVLSPFLSKMISTVARRLRDPDSAVRSACIDAVTAMSSQIRKPPFSTFLKSFMDIISLEQDYNSQIGSALCLAAAIEAAPDPDLVQLAKVLPRLLKLLRSECFKAKPALLSLIGSIVGAGGASSIGVLDSLVPSIVLFLSSDDWAARKAAAEVLGRLAVVERGMMAEYKQSCLATLENRRFDKVKAVRETMNRTLESWKEVREAAGVSELKPPSQSQASKDNDSGRCSLPVSKSPDNVCYESPQSKKTMPTSRSPPSNNSLATIAKINALNNNDRKSSKLETNSDQKIQVVVPPHPSSNEVCKDDEDVESGEIENIINSRPPETKRVLFSGLRAGSHVVRHNSDSAVVNSSVTEQVYPNHKDNKELCLIRKQLVQIEKQQSNLFDLLQRFIGNSEGGMNSLETRVHGLEMALKEISYDLAVSTGRVSTGRVSSNNFARNAFYKLPGRESFSKMWRTNEGRYSTSRLFTRDGFVRNLEFSKTVNNINHGYFS